MHTKRNLWCQLSPLGSVLSLVLLGVHCATAPSQKESHFSAASLRQFVCTIGKQTRAVQGQIWLKVASQEVNGQFLADVVAHHPDRLKIEVNNLLGGTEALISMANKHLKILRNHESHEAEDYFWGGIPVRWVPDLFLGRIPCPEESREFLSSGFGNGLDSTRWKLTQNLEGDLRVETAVHGKGPLEIFLYRFKNVHGRPWPKFLRWEKKLSSASEPSEWVEFSFDDPETDSTSPKKWDIQSSQGRLRLQWRSREAIQ